MRYGENSSEGGVADLALGFFLKKLAVQLKASCHPVEVMMPPSVHVYIFECQNQTGFQV